MDSRTYIQNLEKLSFAGYVTVCVQLYCVGFHCPSLHVSATILYFSILLHCIVQWVLRLCYRLRAALLCWFSLSFTTCFGLHDHFQVCRIFLCSYIILNIIIFSIIITFCINIITLVPT
jgi:hypothetical protein